MYKHNRNRHLFDFHELEMVLDEIACDRNHQIKLNSRTEFKPRYLVGQSEKDKAINAIIEIRAIWDYVTVEAYHNYSNMFSKLSVPISEMIKQECENHKEQFAVYDIKRKNWIVKSKEPHYDYCFDGNDFVEFKTAKASRNEKNFLLVGKYTILKQEPNLLKRTKTAPELFHNFVLPTVKLIVGVPGCGKTTHIIENHRPGSLVLTSCAEGAEDIRARMAAKHESDPATFRQSYRTIDSYLLYQGTYNRHRRTVWQGRYGTVWVDEALMEHPGKIFLVCLFTRCHTMYLLGDPNQLGFINRVNGIKLLYDKSSTYFTPAQTLNVSYRCPVDVMAILSHKYDGGAYSTSDVTLSMQCKRFTRLEYVPKSDKFKYLVFKQAEKQEMRNANYYNVSTIHEFQGKQADDVIIVRMSRNLKEALYKSIPHMLVGVSRHKRSLVYYTPVDDDMKKLIETPLSPRALSKTRYT